MQNKLQKGAENIANKLDIPKDALLNIPKIMITGNNEVTIENHKGIVLFESYEVKVKSSIGVIQVLGENFEIIFVGGSTIVLSGKIKAVGYVEYEE